MSPAFSPRGRAFAPPSCLGNLNASRMAFCAGGPAAWDPLPRGFALGSGPTIAHAQGIVSKRPEDVQLVAAAGQGSSDEVTMLLQQGVSPNVRARSSHGVLALGQATTPLNAAAARGSPDVVKLLLEARADPNFSQTGARVLTPLHEAANLHVAELLIAAGARVSARDPREPDIRWYHQQRGRHEVAGHILAAVRARVLPPPMPLPQGSAQARSEKAFPCMSAAESAAAVQAWSMRGWEAREVACGLGPTARPSTRRPGSGNACASPMRGSSASPMHALEEFECAICMADMQADDACIALPCNAAPRSPSFPEPSGLGGSGERRRCASVPPMLADGCVRAHVFHAACLEVWWRKSCRCPTCRRDVRRWLGRSSVRLPVGTKTPADLVEVSKRQDFLLFGRTALVGRKPL